MEYVIYTDESVRDGAYYSNFYGGALVRSTDLLEVIGRLDNAKLGLGLGSEVKWSKCSEAKLDAYIGLVDEFMDLVAEDKIKVRIMFTQNTNQPTGLTAEQRRTKYLLLYYQFLKHAFGLQYANEGPVTLRIYLDEMPERPQAIERFKEFVVGLGRRSLGPHVHLNPEQVAEVDSKKHVVLQGLDLVLGAMPFKLNDQHKKKPPGASRRGRKTIAKEKLYKHIRKRITKLGSRYKHFNIGITTGHDGERESRWTQPYRHWLFVPKESVKDPARAKPKRK